MQTKMLINGEFVGGTDAPEKILNPATGETIVDLPCASEEQVDAAVQAAHEAFPAWSRTSPAERAEKLLALADIIEQHAEIFASLESRNCGKPLHLVKSDEIPAVADVFRFFAGATRIPAGLAAGEYIPGHTSMIRRDAIGVVGSIAPWNYPLMMAAWKLAPALGAGNCVVLKPSEQTPLTTLELVRHAAKIFPPGVLNVVVGRGETVGQALVSHPKVQMISLTGDIATGKKILNIASSTVKKTHLELGGKAPVIVYDDADLEAVIEAVRTFGYYNAGQDCTAACRIYAGPKIHDNLVADLTAAVKTITYANSDDNANEIGSLISERQRGRVASFVERAADQKHIEICTGGESGKGSGFFYSPTVIAGALQSDEIVQREVFGPVVSVTRFSDPEQAIAWANESEYGLASSVWSKDVGKIMKTVAQLQYGCTWANCHFMLTNEMPHGGLKQSGYGKDMSIYALEDYSAIRHVMIKH